MFRQGGWFDLKAIAHGVLSSAIFAGIAAAVVMLWSYLIGQSGPQITATGLVVGAASLWTYRQLATAFAEPATVAPAPDDRTLALEEKVRRAEAHAESLRKSMCDLEANRAGRLAEIKAALHAQIADAPKVYSFHDANAWVVASDALMDELHLNSPRWPMKEDLDEPENKRRFQKTIAFLRGTAATITERDVRR